MVVNLVALFIQFAQMKQLLQWLLASIQPKIKQIADYQEFGTAGTILLLQS